MKKKMFILIGLLFLLCGCTAEVNLDISGNKISESVVIDAYPEGDYTMDRLPGAFKNYIPAFSKDILADAEGDIKKNGVSYYTRTQQSLGNGYRFNYKYDFSLSNYKGARTLKDGFKSSNLYVDTKENTALLSTDNGGILYFSQYPYLTEVTVKIKTDYFVKENNADYSNGDVYTWVFNRNSNKGIYLLMSLGQDEENPDKDKEDKKDDSSQNQAKEELSGFEKFINEHPILAIVLGILLFIVLVFIASKIIVVK